MLAEIGKEIGGTVAPEFLEGSCAGGYRNGQGACPFASLNIKGCIPDDEGDMISR